MIKYSMRDGGSGKYSTRQSQGLYLPQDPTPSTVFYHTTQVYGALLICWFCVGGLIASALNLGLKNGFTNMLNKLTKPIVNPLLLPNQLEINVAQDL